MNLKHRNKDDQENGTLKCSHCKDQFSSLWNLNNHMRDTHTKTEVCKWFRDGHCRFSDKVCWNIHETAKKGTKANKSDFQEGQEVQEIPPGAAESASRLEGQEWEVARSRKDKQKMTAISREKAKQHGKQVTQE